MVASPSFAEFEKAYAATRPQVVWTTLVSDLETPVSAMLKLAGGRSNSFLFESVEGGSIRGRYSFIGFDPDIVWRCHGAKAEINRRADSQSAVFEPCSEGAIASLRSLIKESRIDLPAGLPPMASGLVGYMAYDMIRLIERLPDQKPDVLGIPDGIFLRPTVVALFDGIEDIVTVITPVWPRAGITAATAYEQAFSRLDSVIHAFDRSLDLGRAPSTGGRAIQVPESNTGRTGYHAMVSQAKEYIRVGDIFQVVPSQRFAIPFELPPFALYRSLRRLNPSPFLFFLDFGDFSIVGSSPEILVRVSGGKVTIRPIAGTRPRGKDAAEDKALAEDLLNDPKELAEHLMLLDLGRNDVGRVAKVGTVKVTEQMVIEHYSHVMHIVSNVEGMLDVGRFDAMDALFGGFTAGTVSGAPKVRAMEIIDELEPEKRGVYGGCIGYFGANGEMDTCIALRTAVVKDDILYVQAGGGVVADSDPEAEYQESCNKARALIRAAEEAVRFAEQKS